MFELVDTRFEISEEGLKHLEQKNLSKRERELVAVLLDSLTNKDIGQRLFITEKCVKFHITNINKKMGTKNRMELFKTMLPYTTAIQTKKVEQVVIRERVVEKIRYTDVPTLPIGV